jgi:hypothetical protein
MTTIKHSVITVSTLIILACGTSVAQTPSATAQDEPQATTYDRIAADCIKQRVKAASEVENSSDAGQERLGIAFRYAIAIDKACNQGLLSAARLVESAPVRAGRQPMESVEHQIARERYARIVPVCREQEKKQAETRAQRESLSAAQPDSWRYFARMDFLLGSSRMYDLVVDECHDALREAEQQLERVDACLKVYNQTVDKKTSDLTNRETAQIGECRSLNLYPPQAKPK